MIGSRRLPADAFIANEAHWLKLDVVYLVFVRGGSIAGARVGGQIGLEAMANPSVDPADFTDPELLSHYLDVDPLAHEFLARDRRNFRLLIAEIREVRLSERRSYWTGPAPNSGSFTLVPRSGRRRRLILLGSQDHQGAQQLLASMGAPIIRAGR